MISINKSTNIPEILRRDGATATNDLCALYDADPEAYQSKPDISNRSIEKMEFNTSIYGDRTVKNQLKEEQHNKCCYCENKFSASSYGDVEHFRPKAAVKIANIRKYQYPGYYWLAYDWNNLFFSCEKCNRSFKKNQFPIVDEQQRMRSHQEQLNINNEDALLIHPSNEDATEFIQFRNEIPYAIEDNEKGKTTISVLKLDRDNLNELRFEYFKKLEYLLPYAEFDLEDEDFTALLLENLPTLTKENFVKQVLDARELFNNAAKPPSIFAGMVRANFPHLPYENIS